MELSCHECGHVTVFSQQETASIVRELTMPAQAKIVECRCQKFQFVLAARAKRPR